MSLLVQIIDPEVMEQFFSQLQKMLAELSTCFTVFHGRPAFSRFALTGYPKILIIRFQLPPQTPSPCLPLSLLLLQPPL